MGVTDYGTQTISFDFKEPGKSENFNKLNYTLNEAGIYSGGLMSYTDATHIAISPLVAFLADSVTKLAVRVETTLSAPLLVSAVAPYCILRFAWNNSINNYADILMVNYASILADDIVIGRTIYTSTILQSTFDYSRRGTSILATSISQKSNLKVLAQEPYATTVEVQGGTVNTGVETITVATGNSPVFSDTTLGRVDLLYLRPNGTFGVIEGIDSSTPVTPEYGSNYILAEIHRGAFGTYITGADIVLINPSSFNPTNLFYILTITTTYSILSTDSYSTYLCTGTGFTITLPANGDIATGRSYTIKNNSSGTIIVDPGASTIDGENTISLVQLDSLSITNDGSNWIII